MNNRITRAPAVWDAGKGCKAGRPDGAIEARCAGAPPQGHPHKASAGALAALPSALRRMLEAARREGGA